MHELVAEKLAALKQEWLEAILKDRFMTVPADITSALKTIDDEATLDGLMKWAVRCPDLEAFRVRLASK
jgi:hypothetical protein